MTDTHFATEPNRPSLIANLITSVIFLLIAAWLMVADLRFPIDMLFQSSASGMVLFIFIGLWFFTAIILSIFPKRIVIAASLLTTLRGSFGWPLNMGMGNTPASQILSVLIFLLALYYLISTIKRWLHISYRPWFRWQHTAQLAVAWIVLGVMSFIPGVLGILQGIENWAGGYVDVSIKGVSLKEKVFEKDSKRVRLTGMVHIADKDFYKDLTHRGENTSEDRHLVLTEGTTDKKKVLPESFATGKTYANMAKKLGLTPQMSPRKNRSHKTSPNGNHESRGFTFMNGDTDISDLSEKHVDLLVRLLTFIGEAEFMELLVMPDDFDEIELHDLMINGLLKTRNDHLMAKFHEQLPNFDEIHMPWGAAHLPDIEDRLLEEGYKIIEETNRPAINFWKRFQKKAATTAPDHSEILSK